MITVDPERLDRLRAAAAAGDRAALEELLAALSPLVHARCRRFLPHEPDAEEAAQDALLSVATRLTSFTGAGSFAGWVSVIAANSARATYRSLQRRAAELGDAVPEGRPDPRTTSVIAGSRLDLLDALDALEQQHPQLVPPVVLRDLAGMSYAEVAAQLGVPLGSVKARIHEGRTFLRRRLVERL